LPFSAHQYGGPASPSPSFLGRDTFFFFSLLSDRDVVALASERSSKAPFVALRLFSVIYRGFCLFEGEEDGFPSAVFWARNGKVLLRGPLV